MTIGEMLRNILNKMIIIVPSSYFSFYTTTTCFELKIESMKYLLFGYQTAVIYIFFFQWTNAFDIVYFCNVKHLHHV